MEKKERVLIIKTGYSEILDNTEGSIEVSFGDILRTTPLLHLYKDDDVTWITDKYAFPLLEGIPYINRLLDLNFTNSMHLLEEEFDTVINLEKNVDICKFANKINAWKKFGFRFDAGTGKAEAFDRAYEVLTVGSDIKTKKENKRTAQELLFEMVGARWNNEEYVLGYKPGSSELYDVGLNTNVGSKWPTKVWDRKNWDELERMLKEKGFKVTRQDVQGPAVLQNLYGYIDWINSHKLIVSCDSLGMHLGLVLGKKVLALFGPTPHNEIYFYGRGKALLPKKIPDCVPCLKVSCDKEKSCMEKITPEEVCKEAEDLLINKEYA